MKNIILLIMAGFICSLLASQSITPEEIQKWEQIGVSKRWISNWKSYGITYQEAKKWKDIGIKNIYDILKWKKKNIKPEEAKKWMKAGVTADTIYRIDSWKKAGINTPEEAKKWFEIKIYPSRLPEYKNIGFTPETLKVWKNAGVNIRNVQKLSIYKKFGINTIEEAKKWEDLNIQKWNLLKTIKCLKEAKITPEEAKKWKNAGIDSCEISKWKKLGINTPKEAKKWDKVTSIENLVKWKEIGVVVPQDIKEWKSLNIRLYNLKDIKKANLTIDKIKEWNKIGIKKINSIIYLTNNGFKNPKQYKPYMGVYINHAVKLKKWGIKPNKLIKTMSYANRIFGKELFFQNKDLFKKAYSALKNNCDEIIKNKWFAKVDMSENKNKCYIFVGEMVQRLDTESFFGKVTRSGLVEGMGNRYFYAENFKGSWIEGQNKIGVIKGNGLFSYDSKIGKQVVPKGTVLFLAP